MKTLMRTHRYLSCFIAPAMIFFAVSGAWQAFRLHEDRKDGSYKAPAALSVLSEVHKAEKLSKTTGIWLKAGEVAIASTFRGSRRRSRSSTSLVIPPAISRSSVSSAAAPWG